MFSLVCLFGRFDDDVRIFCSLRLSLLFDYSGVVKNSFSFWFGRLICCCEVLIISEVVDVCRKVSKVGLSFMVLVVVILLLWVLLGMNMLCVMWVLEFIGLVIVCVRVFCFFDGVVLRMIMMMMKVLMMMWSSLVLNLCGV